VADAGPRFRLGRVIGRSFRVWARNLPLLFALVLVVNLPYIVFHIIRVLYIRFDRLEGPLPHDTLGMIAWFGPVFLRNAGLGILRGLFARLSQAVVIFAVYRRLRGEAPALGGSLRGGLRRFGPVARVALVMLVLDAIVRAAYGVAILVGLHTRSFHIQSWFFYGFDLLPLVLLSPFWVAVPAAVVDRGRIFLVRSWSLTRGYRLRIVGLLLFLYGLEWATAAALNPIAKDLARPARWTLWWTHELLFVSLAAVLAVVGYRALRLNKEGLDVTTLEEVFA
jgi:hypothetical protein